MGVRRRDIDIKWFSSLALIVLGGLLYRFKRFKQNHLTSSLVGIARKYNYTPYWLNAMLPEKEATTTRDTLQPKKVDSPTAVASNYFLQRRYRRHRWLADRIFFR